MMLLFSGSHKTKMTTGVYTSTLVLIGILTGLHIFCFLIIYQFRKNLIDERNLRRNRERSCNVGEVGGGQHGYLEPSAPFGPGKQICVSGKTKYQLLSQIINFDCILLKHKI